MCIHMYMYIHMYAHICIYIYIYIYTHTLYYTIVIRQEPEVESKVYVTCIGRGDGAVGNPHRAQIVRFELFELILLLKLDEQLPVEQFEPTVSQSTVPPPS